MARLRQAGDRARAQIARHAGGILPRLHPDSNGGDRSMEDKLQRVIRAYKALKAAKLV